ncbi:amino acid ABC transporter permease [Granulosicoccus antarcticus]|uniref:Inner membrane amino-acid ABC transporter permease protein YhdY n=1 Tax=Granulosicoccus antarcticus IMCC3135 TaxID=1192854 RepID=A0A2Z2NSP8_9GAMM|nr:amino acid ABC transporter permease [Granulosicoccus antarcticus]ASJ71760.1 Inner membrane amino-acid ABC transporter permease protein YhdY [Granulosicoccus antarcticus IMCC3135]
MTINDNTTSGGVVHSGDLPDKPAPISTDGLIPWMRDNLFNGVFNSLLTLTALALVLYVVPGVLGWTIFNANWTGGVDACIANPDGACWPFVSSRWEQFLYGFYEKSERWRINILLGVLAVGVAWMVWENAPGRRLAAVFMLFVYPIIAFVMLYGNKTLGLPIVETSQWGGFTLTLVIALSGIVASLPLGVLLALGRRSKMPIISLLSTIFIEFWRGIPLVAVLFMATIMFPLFLPAGVTFDQLLRAVIGVALFSSAYMAEVVRGGLQAISKGQYEGAMALGLPFGKMMRLIILPQALKIVIPGIVNTFIGLFKDTTLVLIIALFDLLGVVQASIADPNWSVRSVPYTGYAFVAIVFWICCYSMARYSRYIEDKLNTGHKR